MQATFFAEIVRIPLHFEAGRARGHGMPCPWSLDICQTKTMPMKGAGSMLAMVREGPEIIALCSLCCGGDRSSTPRQER